jgi:S1-C subfamily serine protease
LISNYHVVKDATRVRLLTGLRRDEVASATQAGAGLIDAKVVQVDAANDLALLKADGKFSPLPISSSRSAQLGGTVATVGFADIGLQGFAPKVLAHGHHGGNRWWEVELRPGDDPRYFQISAVFADGHHAAGQMAGRASSAGG